MDTLAFDRLVICGIGLIGGSVAHALRRSSRQSLADGNHPCRVRQIVGVDRDAASVTRALELGLIDLGYSIDDFEAAVDGADFIVLATPVAQTRTLLARLAPVMRQDAVLTDVGSTKGDIVVAAQTLLGDRLPRFVPAHPIAGAEASGVDAGYASLFDARDVVLCPLAMTAADALARTEAFWRCLGARPAVMAAERHDALFASVSHLPHLLAFTFIAHILESDDAEARFAVAGSGFRDFSRIAASSPEMWRDICAANRDAILSDIDRYLVELGALRSAIAAGDAAHLHAFFGRAKDARSDWHQGETVSARSVRHALSTASALSELSDSSESSVADATSGPVGPIVS